METSPIGHPLVRNWGSLLLQGAVAVLFGLLFLIAPARTLVAGVYLFAAFAVADGILAFVWPGITVGIFLALVAVWALLIGIFRIAAAITLRQEIEGEWLLALMRRHFAPLRPLRPLRPGKHSGAGPGPRHLRPHPGRGTHRVRHPAQGPHRNARRSGVNGSPVPQELYRCTA